MSEDHLRYDILTQQALRGMLANILDEVSKTGLPGEHHFFVTFDTNAPGVSLSERMKERYPDEMTIVIQHRFWDLEIFEDRFQIGLSFDDIPETLVIPLDAIKGFYDPSVKFGLQFEVESQLLEDGAMAEIEPVEEIEDTEIIDIKPVKTEKKKSGKISSAKAKKTKSKTGEEKSDPASADDDDNDANGSADVVSLDSFRKRK